MSEERNLALRAAEILYDKKALDIVALDVRHMTVITEYMVICTARNAQQAKNGVNDFHCFFLLSFTIISAIL